MKLNGHPSDFDMLSLFFRSYLRHILYCRDLDIKLVAAIDKTVRTLHGHEGVVRSLTFDSEGEYLVRSLEGGDMRLREK